MTVCPKHRDAYGTRWRTGKTRCCVPAEVAGHKSTTCRGDRGIDRKQSCFVFKETGMLVPVGSRKCSQTLHYFSRNPGGTPIHYLYGYVPPNGVVILKLLI